jgi:transcriptional regulator with XRE-family HTH domain
MQTRLAAFMKANGITIVRLAARSGVSANTVDHLRHGRNDPRRPTMVWLAGGASAILQRRVRVQELFDLGDDDAP